MDLRKLESIYIKVINFVNKIWNVLYNNTFMNHIKELFYHFVGFPYSEYLYWDNIMDSGESGYVRELRKSYQTKFFLLRWIRLLFGSEIVTVETDLTSDPKFALDVAQIGFFKKIQLQKDVNRAFNRTKDNGFRFKRFLTYYEGLTDSKK